MHLPETNEFIFSRKYKLWRHLIYWIVYLLVWTGYWTLVHMTVLENFYKMLLLMPAFALFSYPLAYIVVPRLLLKGKYFSFLLFVLGWGVLGWYFNAVYRTYVFLPGQEWAGVSPIFYTIYEPASFLCMTTTAGCMTITSFAKRWVIKQGEWMQSEKEKVSAQLELLKAQLHPHFLFNTLNNIYAFALQRSPHTPQMILKLSSLLSYMLYECKTEEVLLEKEVEVMKDYIALEKERYGDKIDISVNIEGDIQDKYITPLLILPFLENAFKHGTSEQLDKPWMSVDIVVKGYQMECKVVNSKNEHVPFHVNGVGINNVKKRLEYLYPGKHELKLSDEGAFFVVTLLLQLPGYATAKAPLITLQPQTMHYETPVFADRR